MSVSSLTQRTIKFESYIKNAKSPTCQCPLIISHCCVKLGWPKAQISNPHSPKSELYFLGCRPEADTNSRWVGEPVLGNSWKLHPPQHVEGAGGWDGHEHEPLLDGAMKEGSSEENPDLLSSSRSHTNPESGARQWWQRDDDDNDRGWVRTRTWDSFFLRSLSCPAHTALRHSRCRVLFYYLRKLLWLRLLILLLVSTDCQGVSAFLMLSQ